MFVINDQKHFMLTADLFVNVTLEKNLLPLVGTDNPLRMFNRVDFPAPLWPSIAVIWPSYMSNVRSRKEKVKERRMGESREGKQVGRKENNSNYKLIVEVNSLFLFPWMAIFSKYEYTRLLNSKLKIYPLTNLYVDPVLKFWNYLV